MRLAPGTQCCQGAPPSTLGPLGVLEQWARGGAEEELAKAVAARRQAWKEATQASARADWAAASRWPK
eukprot:5150457-Alexandrium_andersonii.AAC.1